jgi:hypothetical protein
MAQLNETIQIDKSKVFILKATEKNSKEEVFSFTFFSQQFITKSNSFCFAKWFETKIRLISVSQKQNLVNFLYAMIHNKIPIPFFVKWFETEFCIFSVSPSEANPSKETIPICRVPEWTVWFRPVSRMKQDIHNCSRWTLSLISGMNEIGLSLLSDLRERSPTLCPISD